MAPPLSEIPETPEQAAAADALFDSYERPRFTWLMLGWVVGIHLFLGWLLYARGKAGFLVAMAYGRGPKILSRAGAMKAAAVDRGELWRLVSANFLHGDLLHLALNAVALFMVGRIVEAVYGPVRMMWLFLVSGVAGFSLSWLGGTRLSVGASGALFGFIGALIVFGWKHRDQLPVDLGRFFTRNLLPWVVVNLVLGLVINLLPFFGGPIVDNLCHAGGLVGGSVLAMVLGNRAVPGEEGPGWARVGMGLGSAALLVFAMWGIRGKWG